MPDDAERKGIGTSATRAAVLEKLVSSGFVERRKSKKVSTLIPSALGTALITVASDQRGEELLEAAKNLRELGFAIVATEGTKDYLERNGIDVKIVCKLSEGRPNVADLIKNHSVQLIINTPADHGSKIDDSFIRMMAIQYRIPYMTTLAAATASVAGIRAARQNNIVPKSLQEYQSGR